MRRALPFTLALLLSAPWCAAELPKPAPPKPAPKDQQADFVLVEKAKRKLTLYRAGKELKTY